MRSKKIPLVILFSGNGSNMQALYEALEGKLMDDAILEIPLVVTNNPQAYGIIRAEKLGVHCEIISHKDFVDRESYDQKLVDILTPYQPRLCLLAGFMRILSPVFLRSFTTINIHPSLLPLFKGAHAITESFESDMKVAGVSVHYVNEELDGGEIIDQVSFHRSCCLDFESFESKIHELEHQIYPQAVLQVLEKMKKAF